jgi:hypothetical protein
MADNNPYGEIFSKESANSEFGAVVNSFPMDSDLLRQLAEETKNLIMFNLDNNELHILGDNRIPLFPANSALDADIICKVFSKTIFIKLLDLGEDSTTSIESRTDTITITNGDHTLELAANCPPYCQ